MIIYSGTAAHFSEIVDSNQIIPVLEQAYATKLGRKIPPAEISAYQNSLPYMERVVRRAKVASDCGILIEYMIPPTSKRIDFVISGHDEQGNKNVVVVELKQWQKAEVAISEDKELVKTFVGGSVQDVEHPSYKANSYRELMVDYNENIETYNLSVYACACLHNYPKGDPEPLEDARYLEIVEKAPIYYRDDQEKLEAFLQKYVKKGAGTEILYEIENGRIRPSKSLMDHVGKLFQGNQQFTLIDEQKVAFEKAYSYAAHSTSSKKTVVLIKGGPGTGKSVVSMSLFGRLTQDGTNAVFVAPNASFRDTMLKYLVQGQPRYRVEGLFRGSGGFVDSAPNELDVVIVDEAHRLKKKGAYMYQGLNQVEDIVRAAMTSVFFVDDDQAIRPEDVGSVQEIRRVASDFDAQIYEIELVAQFRCAGAEGYMNWLSNTLQLADTANFDGWDEKDFEFKIFNDPNELKQAILEKNDEGFKARLLAGYAWKWTSVKEGNPDSEVEDVTIPEFDFSMPWNSRRVGSTWSIDKTGINQVGCIHTSQGLEFDYVGVIIGPDLGFNHDSLEFITDYDLHKDAQGKKGLRDNPIALNLFIRRIYKVLMSRGMKGCYVYFTDPDTRDYFRSRLNAS